MFDPSAAAVRNVLNLKLSAGSTNIGPSAWCVERA
jgi:hypothetical protein